MSDRARLNKVKPGWVIDPPGQHPWEVAMIVVTEDPAGIQWANVYGTHDEYYRAEPWARVDVVRKEADGEHEQQ